MALTVGQLSISLVAATKPLKRDLDKTFVALDRVEKKMQSLVVLNAKIGKMTLPMAGAAGVAAGGAAGALPSSKGMAGALAGIAAASKSVNAGQMAATKATAEMSKRISADLVASDKTASKVREATEKQLQRVKLKAEKDTAKMRKRIMADLAVSDKTFAAAKAATTKATAAMSKGVMADLAAADKTLAATQATASKATAAMRKRVMGTLAAADKTAAKTMAATAKTLEATKRKAVKDTAAMSRGVLADLAAFDATMNAKRAASAKKLAKLVAAGAQIRPELAKPLAVLPTALPASAAATAAMTAKLNATTAAMGAQLDKLTPKVLTSAAAMRKMGEVNRAMNSGFLKARESLGIATRSFGRLTMGLGLASAAALFFGSRFEREMLRSATAASRGVKEIDSNFAKLSQAALSMGGKTEFSVQKLAEGFSFLTKAGKDTNTAIQAMPRIAELASAANIDLAVAADITTTALSGFQLGVDQLGDSNNTLLTVINRTKTDINQLRNGFKNAAATSKLFGVSMEETAAAIGIMANAGVEGGEAGTSLKRALAALVNVSPQARRQMADLGISIEDARGGIVPLISKLERMQKAFKRVGRAAEFESKLFSIFGQRAGPKMAILLNSGSRALLELKDAIAAAQKENIAKVITDKNLKTLSGRLNQLKSQFTKIMAEFGTALGTALGGFFTKLGSFLSFVSELSPATKALAATMTALAFSVSAVGLAASLVLRGFTSFGVLVSGMTIAVGKLGPLMAALAVRIKAVGTAAKAAGIGLVGMKAAALATMGAVKALILTIAAFLGPVLILLATFLAFYTAAAAIIEKATGKSTDAVGFLKEAFVDLSHVFDDDLPDPFKKSMKSAPLYIRRLIEIKARINEINKLDLKGSEQFTDRKNVRALTEELASLKKELFGLEGARDDALAPFRALKKEMGEVQKSINKTAAAIRKLRKRELRLVARGASKNRLIEISAEIFGLEEVKRKFEELMGDLRRKAVSGSPVGGLGTNPSNNFVVKQNLKPLKVKNTVDESKLKAMRKAFDDLNKLVDKMRAKLFAGGLKFAKPIHAAGQSFLSDIKKATDLAKKVDRSKRAAAAELVQQAKTIGRAAVVQELSKFLEATKLASAAASTSTIANTDYAKATSEVQMVLDDLNPKLAELGIGAVSAQEALNDISFDKAKKQIEELLDPGTRARKAALSDNPVATQFAQDLADMRTQLQGRAPDKPGAAPAGMGLEEIAAAADAAKSWATALNDALESDSAAVAKHAAAMSRFAEAQDDFRALQKEAGKNAAFMGAQMLVGARGSFAFGDTLAQISKDFADDGGNVEDLLSAFKNLAKKTDAVDMEGIFKSSISSLVTGGGGLGTLIGGALGTLFAAIAPGISTAAGATVGGIVESVLGNLFGSITQAVGKGVQALTSTMSRGARALKEVFGDLISTFVGLFPTSDIQGGFAGAGAVIGSVGKGLGSLGAALGAAVASVVAVVAAVGAAAGALLALAFFTPALLSLGFATMQTMAALGLLAFNLSVTAAVVALALAGLAILALIAIPGLAEVTVLAAFALGHLAVTAAAVGAAVFAGVAVVVAALAVFAAALIVGLGALGFLASFISKSEAFEGFLSALEAVGEQIAALFDPFAHNLLALAGLFLVFVGVLKPLVASFFNAEVLPRILFEVVKGIAIVLGTLMLVFATISNIAIMTFQIVARAFASLIDSSGFLQDSLNGLSDGFHLGAAAIQKALAALVSGFIMAANVVSAGQADTSGLQAMVNDLLDGVEESLGNVGTGTAAADTSSMLRNMADGASGLMTNLEEMAAAIAAVTDLTFEQALALGVGLQKQREVNAALTNVPELWRVARARLDSVLPGQGTGAVPGAGAGIFDSDEPGFFDTADDPNPGVHLEVHGDLVLPRVTDAQAMIDEMERIGRRKTGNLRPLVNNGFGAP